MTSKEVMEKLKAAATHSEKDLKGMARFGINVENAWVIPMPKLRILSKEIRKEIEAEERHQIALEIWETKVHEARLLAGFIDEPSLVTEEQMESWVKDFDDWAVCDGICSNLFDKHSLSYQKAIEWSKREEEFVKRAGFVLMAALAVHDKKAKDEDFYPFFERIKEESIDERNFVKKAVNWALRQIGKSRTQNLYKMAIKTAEKILEDTNNKLQMINNKQVSNSKLENQNSELSGHKAALWIAKDALRELTTSKYVLERFGNEY